MCNNVLSMAHMGMGAGFEMFRGGPNKPVDRRMHVTLSDRGTLTLNARCHKFLGEPVGAYLHFSRDEFAIAVEPTEIIANPIIFPFRDNHGARYLNAAPFLRHYGIKVRAGTGKFIDPIIRDDVLYLRLNDMVSVKRERRTASEERD